MKSKTLRYVIIPDNIFNHKQLEEFVDKIRKLSVSLSKYCGKGKSVTIKVDTPAFENYISSGKNGLESSSKACRETLWLKQQKTVNPKWLFLTHDEFVRQNKVFHLLLQWNNCDSWLVDELTTVLFRRCSSLKLRFVQTSEFMVMSDLFLHPFRSQPYIRVHNPTITTLSATSIFPNEELSAVSLQYAPSVFVVERLFFLDVKKEEWILDDDQFTHWESLGLPSPDYQTLGSSSRTRQLQKDRQYMHRYF